MKNSMAILFISGFIFGAFIMPVVFAIPNDGEAKGNEARWIEINWVNSIKETPISVSLPEIADGALPVRIAPIPSTYNDCNSNPQKYDIYDGKLVFDNAPCGGGNNLNETDCYVEQITLYGTSMSPTIKDHDKIYVKHGLQQDYLQYGLQRNFSAGEIIAYDSLGQIAGEYSKNTIHRIVGINEGNAEIVYFEGAAKFVVGVAKEVNELNITRFGENYTLKRPFYVVKGDNNSVCEVVASNTVHGVLAGVAG